KGDKSSYRLALALCTSAGFAHAGENFEWFAVFILIYGYIKLSASAHHLYGASHKDRGSGSGFIGKLFDDGSFILFLFCANVENLPCAASVTVDCGSLAAQFI